MSYENYQMKNVFYIDLLRETNSGTLRRHQTVSALPPSPERSAGRIPQPTQLASLLGRLWQKAFRISQLFRSRGARLLTCHGPFHSIFLDGFLQTLLRTLIHEKSIQDHATRTALDDLVTSA